MRTIRTTPPLTMAFCLAAALLGGGCQSQSNPAAPATATTDADLVSLKPSEERVIVPEGLTFEDSVYDEHDAAVLIRANLRKPMAAELDVATIEQVLRLQGDYLIEQQTSDSDFVALDARNLRHLLEATKLMNLDVTQQQIDEIFRVELHYLRLINVVD